MAGNSEGVHRRIMSDESSVLSKSSAIAIVGAGRLGESLAGALTAAGYRIAALSSRDRQRRECLREHFPDAAVVESPGEAAAPADVVVIATPDAVIAEVCSAIAWRPGQAAVHCSGALGLSVLKQAAAAGALVGVFHPLQTFPRPDVAMDLTGITIALEAADPMLANWLRNTAQELGARPLEIDAAKRAVYHASATMVSGMLAGLVGLAAEMWDELDVPADEAVRRLFPLIESTLESVRTLGPGEAITGPLARGDEETVAIHLEVLQRRSPEAARAYAGLGLACLPLIARNAALSEAKLTRITHLLESALEARSPTAADTLAADVDRSVEALAAGAASVGATSDRGADAARSATANPRKITTHHVQAMKDRGDPITMITAYDAPFARLADESGVDMILVGDSLGQVVLGHESTVHVTMDDIVRSTAAVMNGSARALVVADLPFLSYQIDDATTMRNAGRLIQEGGAHAVKLEGGRTVAPIVRRLSEAGIAVMGHIGLTPQSVHKLGGWRVQGRSETAAKELLDGALALEAAGAFAIVLELIPAELGAEITERLDIPTIGIGAGAYCSGQVQVLHDVLGLLPDFHPKHARPYAELAPVIRSLLRQYVQDVRDGTFPTDAESFFASPVEDAAVDQG